jgi:hypothetical protein
MGIFLAGVPVVSQAIMIAWPGRIMIRPAEARTRGSDPKSAYSDTARYGPVCNGAFVARNLALYASR